MQIYHGSNLVIENPKILREGFTKDFSYGFYCTRILKQAKRWAVRKGFGSGVVSEYEFNLECIFEKNLSILKFSEPCEEWLDFIVKCRAGEVHNYDIIEGPMADDRIYNFINAYIEGNITREQFWILAKFDYPTHQLCFCTEKALRCLDYRGV